MELETYENFDVSVATFNSGTTQQKSDVITSSMVSPTEEHDNSYGGFGGLE